MGAMRRVIERLLNLLAFLLTTRRPVTADEIRNQVAGYGGSSDEAFHRMFERDKELLRRIGIPIELTDGNGWGLEQGYLIDPDAYRLPDPGLTDEERAALAVATRIVRLGGGPAPTEGLLKLGGLGPGEGSEPLGADLGPAADLLGDLFSAVTQRRKVTFDYRGKKREVAPYGLAHRRGHWYLVGGVGDDIRVFRVDRMESLVVDTEEGSFSRPEGFSLRDAVDAHPWEAGSEEPIVARVRFEPDMAWWAARTLRVDYRSGPLEVELPVSNVDAFIGWILSFDDSAVVLEPPELRDQIVERVEAAIA